MTVNSRENSPSRSNRRGSYDASSMDSTSSNRESRLKTKSRSQSRSRNVSASPPRSEGGSDCDYYDDDVSFAGFNFDENDNDNDSNSGSEETGTQEGKGTWTREEHQRFLEGIRIYVNGPWKLVAEHVGTRTVRQTMTHAQKYRQKAARRVRGLRTKQAIMRMHTGHQVSEESLVQEHLRSMTGEARRSYVTPEMPMGVLHSPPGSPHMPSSPIMMNQNFGMPGSPVMGGGNFPMPGSPVGSSSHPMMYANDSVAMPMAASPSGRFPPIILPPLSLETPLSFIVRTPSMDAAGMPVYAPATPPPSYYSSPAVSPVSSLTSRMEAFAPQFGKDDDESDELDIVEDLNQGPTLEECANVLMDVLFDEPALQEEPTDSILRENEEHLDLDTFGTGI